MRLFYPELSYLLVGIFFDVHNELGPYAPENKYCDLIENLLKSNHIDYKREYVSDHYRIDFLVENKVVIEVKAKHRIVKQDYLQTQNYLRKIDCSLGFLVNFHEPSLKPKRIIKTKIKTYSKHSQN